jgi:leader peptidase (prepilin peptidase)/N-methyltransferase
MTSTILAIVALLGLILGSFYTVCIYRIPFGRPKGLDALKDDEESDEESTPVVPVASATLTVNSPPRSFCPTCNATLSWYHNIPLFSWFALGGRCAFCKSEISWRYPLVELLSALAAVFSVLQFGFTISAFVIYALCAALIVISFIDIDYYIIPDVISIPGTAIGITLGIIQEFYPIFTPPLTSGVLDTSLGLLAGAGFLWLIAQAYIIFRNMHGLGFGDVKLLALVGAVLGPYGALYTIFMGSILGAFFGVGMILLRGRAHQIPIQFGPFLSMGTALYLFFGYEPLLQVRNEISFLILWLIQNT